MSSQVNSADNIRPLTKKDRKVNIFGIISIWIACNFVITTILTGMLFIPNISFQTAIIVSVVGSAIGAIPLILMGRIGTVTGLPTMVLSRGAFGQKGAILPALANTIVLIGWSWIQAYMAGLSLNYSINYIFGYDNINLFTILTQVLIVLIVIYGIRGIEATQKLISIAMLSLSVVVFYQLFTIYPVNDLLELQLASNPEVTAIIALDIVIATCFSWMSSVCDYNRNGKSVRGTMIATYGGYVVASTIALGLGAAVGGFSYAQGMEMTYDPTVLLAQHGFGLVAALVVFFSVVSTNAMALYSANMSLLNVIPKSTFWKPAIVLGIVTIIGALAKEALMANFYDFILLIATLYIPIFAIILSDYYVLKKDGYDAEEIVDDQKGIYKYTKGFNLYAYITYIIGALFALLFTYIVPLPTGSTILTFIFSGGLYWVLMNYIAKKDVKIEEGQKLKE